jgi:hypothetical protein
MDVLKALQSARSDSAEWTATGFSKAFEDLEQVFWTDFEGTEVEDWAWFRRGTEWRLAVWSVLPVVIAQVGIVLPRSVMDAVTFIDVVDFHAPLLDVTEELVADFPDFEVDLNEAREGRVIRLSALDFINGTM